MKLEIYTKKACPFCDMLKDMLAEKNIEYSEINIETDSDARDFMLAEGHTTVPQVYRNGKLFVSGGFQGMKQYLEEASILRDIGI